MERIKEEWNEIVYEVIHYDYVNKDKSYILNKYEEVYNKICKEIKVIYGENEYKKVYNELRLDCYKSLYIIIEHK
jgi:hypothetical protein